MVTCFLVQFCIFADCTDISSIMKDALMKIAALLLVLWYCMSIIGFDVHTCHASGRSFVATFVKGLSCEDIHPEHVHSAGNCAHAEHSCSHSGHDCHGCCCSAHLASGTDPCCSDDYQVLQLTGQRTDDDDHRHHDIIADFCPLPEIIYAGTASASPDGWHLLKRGKFPDLIASPDIQSAFSVWRI